MNRSKLTVLQIDRKLKEGEEAVRDIFYPYKEKYDLIMFPPKDDDPECRIQIVFDFFRLLKTLEVLFSIRIDYDGNDPEDFFDFDLTEITEEAFYDVLNQEFDVTTINLSEIKK